MQTKYSIPGGRSRTRLRRLIVAVLMAYAGLAWAQGRLDRQAEFDIAPQSLDAALLQFSDQADLQILVAADTLKGLRTRGFKGSETVRAALERILAGTGLTYEVSGDTVSIRPPAASAGSGAAGSGQREAEPAGARSTGTEQPDTAHGPETSDAEEAPISLRNIEVTGSHIRGVRNSPSPLLQFDRQDIEITGYATLGEFVESLPQNFGGGATQDSIGTEGSVGNRGFGNAPNLRGLGPGATLVLLNGQRLAPGGNSGQFIDISMIPLSAIERVEVLTDGASAIYGADAVGGVINIITRSDYEGAETSLRYGNVTDGDAEEIQAAQSIAGSWGSGNAMGALEYYSRDPLLASDRDFASDADPATTLLPDQQRWSLYANVEQDLNANFTAFGTLLYSSRESEHFQTVGVQQFRDHQESESEMAAGSLGIDWDSGRNWSGRLTASYSDYALDSRFDRAGDVSESSVDTDTLEFDASASGSLYALPAGDLRVALGAGYRKENVSTIFDDDLPGRNVTTAFGELLVPLVQPSNARAGIQALELTLAARYEDFSDFGSEVTPKYGIRWAPSESLSLRGTWGKSYKAPTLAQLAGGNESLLAFIPSLFGIPITGDPLILARTQSAMPDLNPERSTNWTVGFDLAPAAFPLTLSLTYYDIDFTDRIDDPLVGGFAEFFNNAEAFSDLIVVNPGEDLVNALIAGATSFLNLTGAPFDPAAVDLFADLSLTNIAAERQSGIDFAMEYPFETGWGKFDATLQGNYITEFEKTVTPASPTSDALNILYGPVDLRVRAGITWSRNALTTTAFVNYRDSYRVNNEPGSARISSWTTADLYLRYELGDAGAPLDGLSLALSVQNLFDEDPPYVEIPPGVNANPGYDPTNADPLGRFVALQLTKAW